MSTKACRNCRLLSREKSCPNCHSSDFSENYSGLIVILDPEASQLAKKAGFTKKGQYTLRVR
jgi:DNA-directed RNA polymerase subunit E"